MGMTTDHVIPAELARVRRKPERARYDAAAVYAVLDAAPFCHVGTVRAGRPVVLPMVHARVGDRLYLHGSPAAGLFRDTRRGSPVCVTATLLDGLVLSRAAKHHSVNFRSAAVHGDAVPVLDPDQIRAAFAALIDHLTPGRYSELPDPDDEDIRTTAIWEVAIAEASVKTRSGPPLDDEAEWGLPVWAGEVPVRLDYGRPLADQGMAPGAPLPGYLHSLTGG